MGRKRNPISDTGPIGEFAQRLRDRMDKVTPKLTLRSMASVSFCSHSVLAEACAGKTLPTWQVTEAFVRACGADKAEVERWKEAWLQTQRTAGRLRRKLGQADVVVPTRSDAGLPIRDGRLRPIQPDLADPAACIPRPEAAQTFDDLLYQVRVLRIAVGNPSLRQLQHQIRRLDERAGVLKHIGVSTLSDTLSGRRPPSHEVFNTIVRALLAYGDLGDRRPVESWFSPRAWLDAWSRAEYNRERPDLTRRRRVGNIYLMAENQDEGPTASIISEMPSALAAALLLSLHKHIAAGILGELPPNKAQEVIKAMWELTGTVDDVEQAAEGIVLPHSRPKKKRPTGDTPSAPA